MNWKDIADRFLTGARSYVPTLEQTNRQIMVWLTEAMDTMQETCKIQQDEIDIGWWTGAGPSASIPATARVRHPIEAWGIGACINYDGHTIPVTPTYTRQYVTRYALRSKQQYNMLVSVRGNANVNNWPIDRPIDMENASHIAAIFEDQTGAQKLYVYPEMTGGGSVTLTYIPYFPVFSNTDPYWSAWFDPAAASSDTLVDQMMKTTGPPYMFQRYDLLMVEIALREWLAMQRMTREIDVRLRRLDQSIAVRMTQLRRELSKSRYDFAGQIRPYDGATNG